MILFDATTLLVMLSPETAVPKDLSGKVIPYARERLDGLVVELEQRRTKIIIPTPALSEALVRAGPATGALYLNRIKRSAAFRIEPFDERAALEVAAMARGAIDRGDKKDGGTGTWAKIKYDRQIVAIAKVNRVSAIYSDDENVQTFGKAQGLMVLSIGDLPIPDTVAQMSLLTHLEDEEDGVDLSRELPK